MRVDPASLAPESALARRIRAAIARKDAERANRRTSPAGMPANRTTLATGKEIGTEATKQPKITKRAQRSNLGLGGAVSITVQGWHGREDDLQRAVFALIAVECRPGVVAFHPANGGARSKAEAGRFKGMGVVAGIPDLIVIVDGKAHGLELKTATGRMSPAQKTMAERFRRAGSEYAVARGLAEARDILAGWGAIGGGDHA